MIRKLTVAGVCALIALLIAMPAHASHGGVHPTFRTEDVFFHCNGDTKLYNANWLMQLSAESSYVPWDTTPPAASATTGAGCGAYDLGGITNPFYDPVFNGYVTGNIRDITVRLHHLVLSNARNGQPLDITVQAVLDGENLFGTAGKTVAVTPTPGNSSATEQFEFSLTNIGAATDVLDAEGNVVGVETSGAATEDGDGTYERQLTIFVGVSEYPRPGLWVWDATEVPSGMTINPATLAPATVQVDRPAS